MNENWDRSPKKPGGIPFDYGYKNDLGLFEHADHDNLDPNNPMSVLISTEKVFTEGYPDTFNETVWCVACEKITPAGDFVPRKK